MRGTAMKNNSYRILKLKSGEELIVRIAGQKQDKLIIERPMKFHSSTMTDPYGRAKEITILKNWLLYASHEKTTIPKDFVASFLKPDADVLQLYELEKRKDDDLKKFKKNRIIKDPRPNNSPSNFKGAEEIEKMMEMFNKHADKDIVDNIMNEMDNMSEEEWAEMRNDSNETMDDYINYITMTVHLPPEALMSLVDSGLIEEDQIKSIIDALNSGKTSSSDENEENFPELGNHNLSDLFGGKWPPLGHKTFLNDAEPEPRDPDDYGTHWKDWSPFPDDYLEDKP
jgi:hypothetical protein